MKELKEATIALRVTEQEKDELRAIADKLDITMSKLLRQMIKEFLKGEQK